MKLFSKACIIAEFILNKYTIINNFIAKKQYLLFFLINVVSSCQVAFASEFSLIMPFKDACTLMGAIFQEEDYLIRIGIIKTLSQKRMCRNENQKQTEIKCSSDESFTLYVKMKQMDRRRKVELLNNIFNGIDQKNKDQALLLLKNKHHEMNIQEIPICSIFPISLGNKRYIRPLKAEDAEPLYIGVKAAEKTNYYKYYPAAYRWGKSIKSGQDILFLSSFLHKGFLSLELGIIATNAKSVIGVIEIKKMSGLAYYVLNYYRIKKKEEKGCMTSSLKEVSNFLIVYNTWKNQTCNTCLLQIQSKNERSEKIAKKAGYKLVSDNKTVM